MVIITKWKMNNTQWIYHNNVFAIIHLSRLLLPTDFLWEYRNELVAMWLPCVHDDVIKRKHFPHNWSFVGGIHRSSVNSPHNGQWRGALMFSLICAWTNDWVNNGKACDLRCHRAHYDVIVMSCLHSAYSARVFRALCLVAPVWRLRR